MRTKQQVTLGVIHINTDIPKFNNYDIWTLGADNAEGGANENSDIGNWSSRE